MDRRIAEWLSGRDVGSSSKAIMLWLSAKTSDSRWGADTPRDPADLARCLRLLERIPEWKERMSEMADAGGLWPTFIKHWDKIVASFMEECGGTIPEQYGQWPDFTRTYALMRAANDSAYAADNPDFNEVKFDSGPLAGCSMRSAKGNSFASTFAAGMKRRK